jgi:hypothetical protein
MATDFQIIIVIVAEQGEFPAVQEISSPVMHGNFMGSLGNVSHEFNETFPRFFPDQDLCSRKHETPDRLPPVFPSAVRFDRHFLSRRLHPGINLCSVKPEKTMIVMKGDLPVLDKMADLFF